MGAVKFSVCGAIFRHEDHIYDGMMEGIPWNTLAEKLRDESLDLASSMNMSGPASMGNYRRMLVLSQTLQAIRTEMELTAKRQPVEP
jgi:hypothetical protein